MKARAVVKVAVPAPLFTCFDYLIPDDIDDARLQPGHRVRVPFGRRSVIGVITGRADASDIAPGRLKKVQAALDDAPVLPADILALLQWAAGYYLHPIGEVVQAALPALLRQGRPAQAGSKTVWRRVKPVTDDTLATLARAPRQQQLLQLLEQHPQGLDEDRLNQQHNNWRPAMKALLQKNLVTAAEQPAQTLQSTVAIPGPVLNPEQQQAVDAIGHDLASHHIHLVHGVTGSGKTEIYLELSRTVLSAHKQVLVLVPEISLTPQLTQRFQQRLGCTVAVLHSGLNAQQRLDAWHAAASGEARCVIGTRSAVFTPMPGLGLIIIDEEHDGSYKQQDGFRYNARDLSLVRAHKQNIPIVLGSATPSLETLHNVSRARFHIHKLYQRASTGACTRFQLIDLCSQPLLEGLSATLLASIRQHLDRQGQVLLFLNRRGFSPLLLCHDCGWTTQCRRCDAHMTFHRNKRQLHCHHCGAEAPAPVRCENCGGGQLIALGAGTERIEQTLIEQFPQTPVNRIDRDSTRRKGSLQDKLEQAHTGEPCILVGTQMLAKGHDFPNVTLVGILDTDQALYSADFRATEHLAQLITQVSGRTGRNQVPGEVMIQTHHPQHPLLQTLLHHGYEHFCEQALAERAHAKMPPYQHLALLRCEAMQPEIGYQFMDAGKALLNNAVARNVDVFGPLPAPMEKRAGRYRTQMMLQSENRKDLHQSLRQWLPQLNNLKIASKVRWSIDVDPYDTF